MKRERERYEINLRPEELGGGWQLRLIGLDESGDEIEMGGGVFPVVSPETSEDAYADAFYTGEEWLAR